MLASYSVINDVSFIGSEPAHSPPSSDKVQNDWNRTTTSPYAVLSYTGITLLYLYLNTLGG
jgi:hypothetical protein